MSNKKVKNARLEGYNGPLFPEFITVIHNEIYTPMPRTEGYMLFRRNSTRYRLLDFIAMIKNFVARGIKTKYITLVTSDNYDWYRCFTLRRKESIIMIAFPWAQDFERTDNTQSDRHSAVYVSKNITLREIRKMFTNKLPLLLNGK